MQTSPITPREKWDWPSAILIFVLVQVAAARLVITAWTPYLYFTQTLGAFSVAIGLALGHSRFSPRFVRWMAYLYSIVIIPWQMTVAVEAETSFSERLLIVGGRFWYSLVDFFARKPVNDGLFFVVLVSIGFWIIGMTSGYALTRNNNTLAALVPAGVATVIVQLYDGYIAVRIWSLALYIFLCLLYVGRVYFRHNRAFWEERRVFVTAESLQDLSRSVLAVAAVTVFLAWSLPTSLASLKGASHAWDHFARPIRERLENGVTALQSPYGTSGEGDFYGDSLSLGRNAAQGDSPVFTVRVNSVPDNVPPRYYWRGHVYDTYVNGRWASLNLLANTFSPDTGQASTPDPQATDGEGRFTFTMLLAKQGLMYTPSDPFWVNRPGQFFAVVTPDQGQDISSWEANPELRGGDKYQVRNWVSNPTIEELQGDGTDYPAWVTARYLQVPPDVAAQLQPIAQQVTEGLDNPYDKAEAITNYLRETIQYSPSVAATPKDVDPVLWVLKDYKKGFCIYYASAEVLMLRSIGIPARFVAGFAQGEQDPNTGLYTVRRAQAHAWPEVYFPGTGWVEFEPTGNQNPLVRPSSPQGTPTPGGPSTADSNLNRRDPLDRASRLNDEGVNQAASEQAPTANHAFLIVTSLVLAGVLLLAGQRFGLAERLPIYISGFYARNGLEVPPWVRRWERWMHIDSIERSFHAINYSLRSLGLRQPVHLTPAQRAAVLAQALPGGQEAVNTLLLEHQSTQYTREPGSATRARRAAWTILALTWRARLIGAWDRFDSRFTRYG